MPLSGPPCIPRPKEHPLSFFYEIRSSDKTVLKREVGYPDREATTEAARADAKRLKAVPKPPTVGRILVGQNSERATP